MKKQNGIQLSYDIHLEKGSCKPTSVRFWSDQDQKKFKAEAPFKYMADALVGLSMIKMNSYLKSPVFVPQYDYNYIHEAWTQLDPLRHVFERSQERIESLAIPAKSDCTQACKKFEEAFIAAFEHMQKPWGFDFSEVGPLLDTISWFEEKSKSPLLFNTGYQWSRPFREKLMAFYSFLYNLRSVVAVDINAHIEDPSHEAVKVDAITDYLPKAEYIVNDALLYWNFKKLATPWSSRHRQHVNGDHPVDTLFVEPMEKAFKKYSHNAVNLIENLPARFLESMNPVELEEALYLVQMDWLLGSDAGLLFRVREELYGIQNGYEEIFWQDLEHCGHRKAHKLSVCCEVKDNMIASAKAA